MKKRSDKKYLVLVTLIFLFHLVNNIVVLYQDSTYYTYDLADNRLKSINYYYAIKSLDFKQLQVLWNEKGLFYPPLLMISSFPFYLMLGKTQDAAALTNSVYLLLLLFSVYYLAKKLKNSHYGVLSVLILSFFPGIYSYSRVYMADFALASIVAVSICFLVYSNKFKNKTFTILFGISCGLGLLIKWAFVTYLIGPFLCYFIYSFWPINKTTEKQIQNLSIAILLGLLLFSAWYYNKIPFIIQRGIDLNKDYSIQIGGYDPWTYDNFKIYYKTFFPAVFGYFLQYVLYCLLIFLFLKSKHKSLIISWILIPYIIISYAPWKNTRYLLPMIPAFALILGYVFYKIITMSKNKLLSYSFYLIILVVLMNNFIYSNYVSDYGIVTSNDLFKYGLPSPRHFDYELDRITSTIVNNTDKHNSSILIIPNSELLDALYHKILLKRLSYTIDRGIFCIGSGGSTNCDPLDNTQYRNKEYICNQDFVIDYDGKFSYDKYSVIFLPKESEVHTQIIQPLITNWNMCKGNFKIIEKIENKTDTTTRYRVNINIHKKVNPYD